jgi:mRNA interferase RelE/StbE
MYALEIKAKAQKQLETLPKKDQRRVLDAFDLLRENPTAGKQLEGKYKGLRSLRLWPYRIIYAVDHRIITVTVVKIGHRKDVYR